MKIIPLFRKATTLMWLFSLSFVTFSCSKKSDSSATPANSLTGSWKVTGFFVKQGTAAEQDYSSVVFTQLPCLKDVTITFDNKGLAGSNSTSCDLASLGLDIKATYTLNNSLLTVSHADGSKDTYDVSFSGNTMSWSQSDSGVSARLVFTKA